MKRGLLFVGVCLLGGMASAQETPAVLNDPPAFVDVTKQVINRLNPSYETLWLISDGEFAQGVSASLYNFSSHEIPIASARIGFGTNETLYAGPSLDLPGIARRFVPQTVKGVATTGPLDTIWSFVGKYARVGIIGGYSWAQEEPVYGLSAGAALSF